MLSAISSLYKGCYFIGIGGVSMSALARLLHDRGIPVRGSDATESSFTCALRESGIPVHIGESEDMAEDTVIYTGAISPEHSQLRAARERGRMLISRAELLGIVARDFPHVVSVAGCHGKTTTSCMLAHIFMEGERPFTCHIGGEDLSLTNYYSTGGEYFVTEACEFQRSFLHLESEVAVVLNCDRDHTDCYKSKEEILEAYRDFAAKSRKVIVNADDVAARSIPHTLSFGLHNGDVRAERLRCEGEKYSFTVTERGIPIVRIRLKVVGIVNVMNALAAYAATRLLGFTAEEIRKGLESFQGVRRRFERVGDINGVPVICDYAHHPREIAATFKTAQRLSEGRVHLVFQPHTYTRTRDMMTEFVDVLKRAESPILYKTYAAREKYEWEGSAACLASKIAGASYVQSPEQLRRRLNYDLGEKDMVLVLGAGDIYDIVKDIL